MMAAETALERWTSRQGAFERMALVSRMQKASRRRSIQHIVPVAPVWPNTSASSESPQLPEVPRWLSFHPRPHGRVAASRELISAVTQLLNEAGVAQAAQQPGAFHYLGEVIYAQGITRAFQEGFMVLAIAYLIAVTPASVLSQTRAK